MVLIIIGVILMVVGFGIMGIVVWVDQTFGVPPFTSTIKVPTTPFWIPGAVLGTVGVALTGLSGFLLFWRWFMGTQKEAAKEIISEGIRKWKEPSPPSPPTANVKYCPKCGASMSKESTYCPKCGQKQSET
jgi:heme/copper-type cytochrome/quinol oxidase subunit 1